jgi:hypothetical protein
MSYCFEKGISHDEFLAWSNEARAKTLAYALEQASRCQLCGTAEWEWDENRFAYEPEEKFCHGCHLKAVASEGNNSLPGTTVELTPVTDLSKAVKKVRHQRLAQMDMGDDEED